MNTPTEIMDTEERDIEHDLLALGVDKYALSCKLQPNNVAVFTLVLKGQAYTGTHDMFSRAFWESKTHETPLDESLADLKKRD